MIFGGLKSPGYIEKLLPGRNYGLDAMRASAILMVVIGHCYHFFEPWFPKIHRFAFITGNGVELFFSLSGFLIGGILIRQFETRGDLTARNLFSFWKRRWIRTIPVYWLAILINLPIAIWATKLVNLHFPWKHFLFIHTWSNGSHWFFPASYSLSIEEWFYFLVPIAFLITGWIFIGRANRFALLIVCLVTAMALYYLRTVFWNSYPIQWDAMWRKATIARLDACVYGVLMALAFHKWKELLLKGRIVLMVAGLAMYFVTQYCKYLLPDSYATFVLYFSLIPTSFALMIPFFYGMRIPKRKNILVTITAISVTSYAVYLFHLSPFNEIAALFKEGASLIVVCGIVAMYLVVTATWSWLWYRYVETPIVKLRDRI